MFVFLDEDEAPILSAGSGNISDTVDDGLASASLTFKTNGDRIATTITGGASDEGDWITPKTLASSLNSLCTIRAHVESGALTTGDAADTDHALSTERSFGVATTEPDSSISAVVTFTIKFNGVPIHTVQRTLSAVSN